MDDYDDEIYNWYYRSDIYPMSLKETGQEWTMYEESEDIEIAYQYYLLSTDQDDLIEEKEKFIFNLEDSKINLTLGVWKDGKNQKLTRKINFELGVETHGKNEKLIGRFQGDVNEKKELKNELTSQSYRWYFDNRKKYDIFTLSTPIPIDNNEKIVKFIKIYFIWPKSLIFFKDCLYNLI